MTDTKTAKRFGAKLIRVWAVLGLVVAIGFAGWCLIAYRATTKAREALLSDAQVTVTRGEGYWAFVSNTASNSSAAGLVFFPGSLVEPAAYAPLARAVAEQGYPVLLVELPRRGAFGGANGGEIMARARMAMKGEAKVTSWVIGGHSLGGAVAARLVKEEATGVGGLVLVGTTHPREFSLADFKLPVVKIMGTCDGLAGVKKCEETRGNLPATTRWVVIEGANHSQFGWYGFQPGDQRATMGREQQQQRTVEVVLEGMGAVVRGKGP